ncbi:16S rRNA (uracil(1498)-N(3))-methyltransferase [Acidiferrimicrobium sp. IK]|uniref:RsmE family RNA methyltransferase n=1 Tax=Acidiferrimicrobium sp. IK TaxID=2871700 RepID=UPI0021CB5A5F|nr:RsmE family RNA methyltransferase [Acidiferrimicrobium sp. IK]MCU4187313.1 16S rRNA (uracil(1498)-N(3))-methyltransferase [Acidiferrimicrobium sp. IK]
MVVVAPGALAGDDVALEPADAHHLGRVLRLRSGEPVVASDGRGSWRQCVYAPPGGLDATGPVVSENPPAPAIAVGFVPTKGDRPEWTVQKLTELGVDRIVIVSSGRSVVRWDGERAARHLAKLREVARQAAMQSRRVWLPIVEGVAGFADLAAGSWPAGSSPAGSGSAVLPAAVAVAGGGGHRTAWSLAAPGGEAPALGSAACGAAVGILVGPEGGWTPEEESVGLRKVGLGELVLRAETAALAAGALLAGLRAGLVAPAG